MKQLLDLIATKWTLLIILAIHRKQSSFTSMKRDLAPITPKILSARLKLLVQKNVIVRKENPDGTTHYSLTQSGHELVKILNTFRIWGLTHITTQGTCGAHNCRHYPLQ